MLKFELPSYRPVGIRLPGPTLGQTQKMGQTGGQIAVGVSSLLVTALGVGTTWIGIRAGKRERGNYSTLGYAVAVFGSIVVISSLAGAAAFLSGLVGTKPVA